MYLVPHEFCAKVDCFYGAQFGFHTLQKVFFFWVITNGIKFGPRFIWISDSAPWALLGLTASWSIVFVIGLLVWQRCRGLKGESI